MEKILKILNEVKDGVDYRTEKSLMTNKILDSIDLVALMGDLEDEFGIEITYDMLTPENFDSLDRIWSLVQSCQKN